MQKDLTRSSVVAMQWDGIEGKAMDNAPAAGWETKDKSIYHPVTVDLNKMQ